MSSIQQMQGFYHSSLKSSPKQIDNSLNSNFLISQELIHQLAIAAIGLVAIVFMYKYLTRNQHNHGNTAFLR